MSVVSDPTCEETSCVNCRKNMILLNKCNFVIELLEATIQQRERELKDAVDEAKGVAEFAGKRLCATTHGDSHNPWQSAKDALQSCTTIIKHFHEEFGLIRKCMDNMAIKVETLEEIVYDLNKHKSEDPRKFSIRLVQQNSTDIGQPSSIQEECRESDPAQSQALGRHVESKRDSTVATTPVALNQQRDQDVSMLNRVLRRLDEASCTQSGLRLPDFTSISGFILSQQSRQLLKSSLNLWFRATVWLNFGLSRSKPVKCCGWILLYWCEHEHECQQGTTEGPWWLQASESARTPVRKALEMNNIIKIGKSYACPNDSYSSFLVPSSTCRSVNAILFEAAGCQEGSQVLQLQQSACCSRRSRRSSTT
eukprot:456048-Hanusia_phi.AAC.1